VARARLIKPGFFSNATLGSLPPHARLLFAGLWTLADREGRMKDDPMWIKGQIFPYEVVDVDDLLTQLAKTRFIHRYKSGTNRYLAVANFEKHQTPHMREAESNIPPPNLKKHSASTVPAPDKHEASTGFSGTSPAVSKSVSDPVAVTGSGSSTGGAATAGADLLSSPGLSGALAEPGLTDFELIRTQWKDHVGFLTTDQVRRLREFHAVHPDWAWAVVNETIAAPKPSWDYAATILDRCEQENRPPSSLAKTRRPVAGGAR
jgi:hypothetical protein